MTRTVLLPRPLALDQCCGLTPSCTEPGSDPKRCMHSQLLGHQVTRTPRPIVRYTSITYNVHPKKSYICPELLYLTLTHALEAQACDTKKNTPEGPHST